MADLPVIPQPEEAQLAANRARIQKARKLITGLLRLDTEENGALSGFYEDYYLQIDFSEAHPLLMLSLAKPFYVPMNINMYRALNRVNLNSILGSHTVNGDVGCYSFRLTQWLFSDLTADQVRMLLDRAVAETEKGIRTISL